MIINALNTYYQILTRDEDSGIALNGFSYTKPSFEFNIDKDARLTGIVSLGTNVLMGKKEVRVLKSMLVPQQMTKTSGIKSNFLCENAGYVLGLHNPKDEINKTEQQIVSVRAKAPKKLEAFRQRQAEVLSGIDNNYSKIFLKFIDEYSLVDYDEVVTPLIDELNKGGWIVFRVDGKYLHEIEEIKDAWLKYLQESKDNSVKMQCSVSGEITEVAKIHTSINGVKDAQTSGASLVSFNAESYKSYGKEQGFNAPVSEKVMFNYTTVLNHMLSSKNQKIQLGDATTVFWAESTRKDYVDYLNLLINPTERQQEDTAQDDLPALQAVETERKMSVLLEAFKSGTGIDYSAYGLDQSIKTYVLGLSPNASRLSVRFFYAGTFSSIIEKIMMHYKDLEIQKMFSRQPDNIPVWSLLKETANPKNGVINPLLAGSVVRSMLSGGLYPRIMYNSVINRIRCDRDDENSSAVQINYVRAAIIKAYLSRYARIYKQDKFKEVLSMSLNEQATDVSYLLGRLFAVLEKVQRDANPGINATIKDRYFSSACATPAAVFPTLLRLSQNHMAKLEYGGFYDKRISEILNKIEEPRLPAHLNLEQQGTFILGYYHQNNDLYKKSEQKEKTVV